MNFNPAQPQIFLEAFRRSGAPVDTYVEELFLVGKMDDSTYDEVAALLNGLKDKELQKAYKSKQTLLPPDGHTHYEKHLSTLIAWGKQCTRLRLGKMLMLLGYARITVDSPVLMSDGSVTKKPSILHKNIGLLPRFADVEQLHTNCWEAIRGDVAHFAHLKVLRIENWDESAAGWDFSPFSQLEELYFYGRLGAFLSASTPPMLPHLRTLSLKGNSSFARYMESIDLPAWLGSFANLKRLELMYLSAEKLGAELFSPNLEEIVLIQLPNLRHLPDALPQCPNLRVIATVNCPNLQLSDVLERLHER